MKYKKGEGYWLGKKRIGFVPWNKGTHGLQVAWNKGKSAPWAKNLPQQFKKGLVAITLEVDNGRVLCVKCHKETDTYGTKSKKKKNNERFEYA